MVHENWKLERTMYRLKIERRQNRRCRQREKHDAMVQDLIDRGLGLQGGHLWSGTYKRERVDFNQEAQQYVYVYLISLQKVSRKRNKELVDKQAANIKARIIKAGKRKQYGNSPWLVEGENGIVPMEKVKDSKAEKDYGKVVVRPTPTFTGIFGREAHIARITSAIEVAQKSQLQKRYHVLLYGPPGCGKTDLLNKFCKSLGAEGQAYLMIDATSTTQAGIIKKLMDSPVIPPVMVVEEIEKAEESALRWLLGVLDQRGEVRRINARVGYQYRNVRLLVLATANDITLFRRAMSGALASRFAHQIYCPRPDRDTMHKILLREVTEMQGNPLWIDPALDFCMNDLDMNDPREIIPICLGGGDRLLDGSYQEVVRQTREPANVSLCNREKEGKH
jgi:SpoVK/Ycf46/Vps4 family AAA+-type ATPase